MKKLTTIAAIAALAAAAAGCRTVCVDNRGEGRGWKVSVRSNMMKSEADNISATVNPDGTITFGMGGLRSEPSEEFAKSLMTLTYVARLAAAVASPAAAGVPLNDSAADPQAVAAILAAQASAKAATVKAKADAAVGKIEAKAKADAANAQQGCAGGSCQEVQP